MKLLLFLLSLCISSLGWSAVDCVGVPQAVKMGEYGNQEAYVIVRIHGLDYRLGMPEDEATKIRVSLAQTALVSGFPLKLRIWGEDACIAASENKRSINSVQLVR
jgi:hypothetical protein